MFDRIAKELMAGHFVCQVSDAAGYDYLSSPINSGGSTNAQEMSAFLQKIGMTLSSTRSGGAYFAIHARLDDEAKKSAKAIFTNLKNTIRPLTAFLELVMRAQRDDTSIIPGEKMDLNQMMVAIAQNPSLTETLRVVSNLAKTGSGDGSDRERLKKIVKRFETDGYLCAVNREKEIYQITGKIEYIQDVIAFLIQHDKITEEDEAFENKVTSA